MTEFQLLILRRLDGTPRRIAGLWLRPEDVRRDPALAERAYRASVRDENRGIYDFLVSAPLAARRSRRGGSPTEELCTARARKFLALRVRYYGIAALLASSEQAAGSASDTTGSPNHNEKVPRHG